MKLKQISIPIENSYDRILEVTEAFGDKGINLRALNLVDTENLGLLRLLVNDVQAATHVLMRMQIPASIEDVVAAEIEDRPGRFAYVIKLLRDNDVKIMYSYAFLGMNPGKAVMIFKFNDNERAIRILDQSEINLLTIDAFEDQMAEV